MEIISNFVGGLNIWIIMWEINIGTVFCVNKYFLVNIGLKILHDLISFRHASLHGPFDRIVGVVGMDLTLKYFYKILVEQLPICEQETVR